MKVLLIKNNRLYGYRLPDTIKNNFWITDIDNYDNSQINLLRASQEINNAMDTVNSKSRNIIIILKI